jgi:hypothetical protein
VSGNSLQMIGIGLLAMKLQNVVLTRNRNAKNPHVSAGVVRLAWPLLIASEGSCQVLDS